MEKPRTIYLFDVLKRYLQIESHTDRTELISVPSNSGADWYYYYPCEITHTHAVESTQARVYLAGMSTTRSREGYPCILEIDRNDGSIVNERILRLHGKGTVSSLHIGARQHLYALSVKSRSKKSNVNRSVLVAYEVQTGKRNWVCDISTSVKYEIAHLRYDHGMYYALGTVKGKHGVRIVITAVSGDGVKLWQKHLGSYPHIKELALEVGYGVIDAVWVDPSELAVVRRARLLPSGELKEMKKHHVEGIRRGAIDVVTNSPTQLCLVWYPKLNKDVRYRNLHYTEGVSKDFPYIRVPKFNASYLTR
jgi:hypothetical protein